MSFHQILIKKNSSDFVKRAVGEAEKMDYRMLSTAEENFISVVSKDFASKTIEKNVYGRESNINKDKAKRLLTTAALYYNDEDTQEEINDKLKYIGVTEFSKEELKTAYNYLKEQSQGETFMDTYKESMKSQELFTSTPKQFKNPNWNPNSSIGVYDASLETIPALKGGVLATKTLVNTTKIVSPVFIQGGKNVIKKADGFYDDVTLGTISQMQKVAPNIINKYVVDPVNSLKIIGGVEVTNEVLNESSPIPNTVKGSVLSGIKNTKDFLKDKDKINDIKKLFIDNVLNGDK